MTKVRHKSRWWERKRESDREGGRERERQREREREREHAVSVWLLCTVTPMEGARKQTHNLTIAVWEERRQFWAFYASRWSWRWCLQRFEISIVCSNGASQRHTGTTLGVNNTHPGREGYKGDEETYTLGRLLECCGWSRVATRWWRPITSALEKWFPLKQKQGHVLSW